MMTGWNTQSADTGTLSIESFGRGRDELAFSFKIGGLRFSTTYWYGDVDLPALEERYGLAEMERIYFHIGAFEVNKLASLRPARFDAGPFCHLVTPAFKKLWWNVFIKVWAQWRYENDLPDYHGPEILADGAASEAQPVHLTHGPVELLAFCGGGKDSLVAMNMLTRAGIGFSSFAYSHSIYGTAERQHALISNLLDHCSPSKRHRQWVFDDFLDSPVVALHPEFQVRSMLAAETPSSLFGALPVMLQHGYRYIALAHERSADVGNLIWSKTGEDVNHQWGKSLEAECLLNRYIQSELISNISYFSVLKPIYDVLIFNMLRDSLTAVPDTHSCNISKPWCGQCPKCAYVWLNYMAYLPVDLVNSMFGANLFDVEANQLFFRQMLGLEDHTPFECIGEVTEARLAFELCRLKGLTGRAMTTFAREVPAVDIEAVLKHYLSVDTGMGTFPDHLRDAILAQMETGTQAAYLYLRRFLQSAKLAAG